MISDTLVDMILKGSDPIGQRLTYEKVIRSTIRNFGSGADNIIKEINDRLIAEGKKDLITPIK